jgi:hypothetical protein
MNPPVQHTHPSNKTNCLRERERKKERQRSKSPSQKENG